MNLIRIKTEIIKVNHFGIINSTLVIFFMFIRIIRVIMSLKKHNSNDSNQNKHL